MRQEHPIKRSSMSWYRSLYHGSFPPMYKPGDGLRYSLGVFWGHVKLLTGVSLIWITGLGIIWWVLPASLSSAEEWVYLIMRTALVGVACYVALCCFAPRRRPILGPRQATKTPWASLSPESVSLPRTKKKVEGRRAILMAKEEYAEAKTKSPSGKPLVCIEGDPAAGFIVTSPVFPELVTGGSTLEKAVDSAREALGAVLYFYRTEGKEIPADLSSLES